MQEIYKILIGIGVLALGIPIGNILAKATKEELKPGKKWFMLTIGLSLIGGVVSLILGENAMVFSLVFVAIVTGMSLKKRDN